MIDDDFWGNVLEPYANDPAHAFILAQTLFILKESIRTKPKGKALVVQALEQALEKLYPYTAHHKASRKLFTIALEGNLVPDRDPMELARQLKKKR